MVEELFIPIHYLTKIHIISCIFVINFGCFNLFGNHQKKQEELEKFTILRQVGLANESKSSFCEYF